MFPVGDLTKSEVRDEARRLGLHGGRQARQPRDLLRPRRTLFGVPRSTAARARARRHVRGRTGRYRRRARRSASLHRSASARGWACRRRFRSTSCSIDASANARHGRPTRIARAHHADRLEGQLDCRTRAGRLAGRRRPRSDIATGPAPARVRRTRCWTRRAGVRHAADGDHARTGGGVLCRMTRSIGGGWID